MKVRIHDVKEAREHAGPGKIPVLRYSNGARHALLPTGQRINVGLPKPDKELTGKQSRRERIARNRRLRELQGEPA